MFHWPSIDLLTCKFGFIDRDFQDTSGEGEKLNRVVEFIVIILKPLF